VPALADADADEVDPATVLDTVELASPPPSPPPPPLPVE
jgi:hypothetical protein